jgi:hypothetical protein
MHRYALALVADGLAQKVIAIKLGMHPSTVSAVLNSARRRLGPWVCIDCGKCPDQTLDQPVNHWREHPQHRLAMFNIVVKRIEALD